MSELPATEMAGEGGTVVLLHGFGGSAGQWERVRQGLIGPSIAFDLPGHGAALGWSADHGTISTRDAVIGELERRHLGAVHLVGHSRGGAIAMLVALKCPGRIASLTLVAPGGCGPEIAADNLKIQAAAQTRGDIIAALESLYAPDTPSPQAVETLVEQRSDPRSSAALLALVPSLLRDGQQGMLDLTRLQDVPFPIHVLWGTRDAVLPAAHAEAFRGMASVELIEGAGHMLPETHADAVAAAINHQSR